MNVWAILLGALCSAVLLGISDASAATGWSTVWFDDFDGSELDRTKWAPEESCWGGGNNERQCYTDRPANIVVEDSVLKLKAQRERFRGPMFPVGMREDQGGERTQRYTSGKVKTRGLASWTYGRFSARIKLPEGQGTWPAFWMMPEDDAYGEWPLSGEIDIMEAVNLKTPCADCPGGIESRTSGALHFGDLQPDNTYFFKKAPGTVGSTPADEWRVYTVEWALDQIQWFVDGEVILQLSADQWFTTSGAAEGRPFAPFDQPFHLIINYAVGGNLAEKSNKQGFKASSYPSEMLVDWVRVEQCAEDSTTGRACMTDVEWSGVPEGPWETQAR